MKTTWFDGAHCKVEEAFLSLLVFLQFKATRLLLLMMFSTISCMSISQWHQKRMYQPHCNLTRNRKFKGKKLFVTHRSVMDPDASYSILQWLQKRHGSCCANKIPWRDLSLLFIITTHGFKTHHGIPHIWRHNTLACRMTQMTSATDTGRPKMTNTLSIISLGLMRNPKSQVLY